MHYDYNVYVCQHKAVLWIIILISHFKLSTVHMYIYVLVVDFFIDFDFTKPMFY